MCRKADVAIKAARGTGRDELSSGRVPLAPKLTWIYPAPVGEGIRRPRQPAVDMATVASVAISGIKDHHYAEIDVIVPIGRATPGERVVQCGPVRE